MLIRRTNKWLPRALVLPLIAFSLLAAEQANAASCSSLKAELARLSKGGGNGEAAKWRQAWLKQRTALDAAENDARFFKCNIDTSSRRCSSLNAKIKKMQKNLSAIDRQVQKSGRGGDNKRQISRIQKQIAAQNCDGSRSRAASSQPARNNEGGGFLQKLLAPKQQTVEAQNPRYRTLPNGIVVSLHESETPAPSGGKREPLQEQTARLRLSAPDEPKKSTARQFKGSTFRTMCVRTCDGFFFPVSFSTSKKHFAEDAMRCAEMCPTAQTELFAYPNPGGQPEDMTSMSGTPYLEIVNAYRFKKEVVEGCSCRAANTNQARQSLQAINDSGNARSLFQDDRSPEAMSAPSGVNPLAIAPLLSDQIPARLDPATRENMLTGFNASAPLPKGLHNSAKTEDVISLRGGTKSLPVLGKVTLRSSQTMTTGSTSNAPVFATKKPADDDTSPVFSSLKHEELSVQSDEERASIRVVGPDYFVAQ